MCESFMKCTEIHGVFQYFHQITLSQTADPQHPPIQE